MRVSFNNVVLNLDQALSIYIGTGGWLPTSDLSQVDLELVTLLTTLTTFECIQSFVQARRALYHLSTRKPLAAPFYTENTHFHK